MNAPHTRLPTQKSVGSVAIGGAASRGRSVPLGTDVRVSVGAVCFGLRLKALSEASVSLRSLSWARVEHDGSLRRRLLTGHPCRRAPRRNPGASHRLGTQPHSWCWPSATSIEVLTDAGVLLCGLIGTLVLRDLGYTGPLVEPGPAGSPRRGALATGSEIVGAVYASGVRGTPRCRRRRRFRRPAGGLEAAACARRGDARRPPQLPSLPAAHLPGRDRSAFARRDRLSAPRRLQARP